MTTSSATKKLPSSSWSGSARVLEPLKDRAREMGYPRITHNVKTALNTEHNVGRLNTDWQRAWKPRKG